MQNKPPLKTPLVWLMLLAIIAVPACGYLSSGEWEDDAGNWERAFHSERPTDVVVLHSKYWQSAHWSSEFEYFFEIEANAALSKQLFASNELVQLEGAEAQAAREDYFAGRPEWFAPKPVDSYEIWAFADPQGSHFRVFVDKETGNIFITDYQILCFR